MLKMLNATIHHEMLSPLKSNVILSKRLLDETDLNQQRVKQMIRTLSVSSELLLHHCNDLLDYHMMGKGCFRKHLSTASIA